MEQVEERVMDFLFTLQVVIATGHLLKHPKFYFLSLLTYWIIELLSAYQGLSSNKV